MIGPYLMACLLLILAGAMKMVRPADTVRALTQVFHFPRMLAVGVPSLAAIEMLLGTAAALWPKPGLAGAVAASYVVFAGFVLVIKLRHGAVSSCGCFGTPDTPATWLHAIINVVLASAAVVIAVNTPGDSIVSILRHQPWHGLPLMLAVLVGTWMVVLVFSNLAQLSAVRKTLTRTAGVSP